jgi:hypothetical protein
MNDPHVTALIYRIKHGNTISYNKALPFEHEMPLFRVSIKDYEARFEMKEHFSTAEHAREVVEPFVRGWEFVALLKRGPSEFALTFSQALVEDRYPPKSAGITAEVGEVVYAGVSASLVVERASYPPAPTHIGMNAEVQVMASRYFLYREGGDTLASMAYFCLTVLELAAAKRAQISRKFGISSKIVNTLGRLTGEKGGMEARKSIGRSHEFTPSERSWIEEAVKTLITRAAEVAHDPAVTARTITMSDLPNLPKP